MEKTIKSIIETPNTTQIIMNDVVNKNIDVIKLNKKNNKPDEYYTKLEYNNKVHIKNILKLEKFIRDVDEIHKEQVAFITNSFMSFHELADGLITDTADKKKLSIFVKNFLKDNIEKFDKHLHVELDERI